MNGFLYCITHECYVPFDGLVFDNCITTTSLPPELPEGWELAVEPPTPDELESINQNATELALDLEIVL